MFLVCFYKYLDNTSFMSNEKLSEIMSDISAEEPGIRVRDGSSITIWVSPEDHERYCRLQKKSNRQLSKKLRAIVCWAIDEAERRINEQEAS